MEGLYYQSIRERMPEEIVERRRLPDGRRYERVRCAGCQRMDEIPVDGPIDVAVDRAPRRPLSGVEMHGVPLVRGEFARWLLRHEPRLLLGRVWLGAGRLLEDVHTLRFPRSVQVLVRGQKGSLNVKFPYSGCAVCGRWWSAAYQLPKPLYVLKADAAGQPLMTGGGLGICVRSDLVDEFVKQRFEKLFLGERVEVFERPVELIPGLDDVAS